MISSVTSLRILSSGVSALMQCIRDMGLGASDKKFRWLMFIPIPTIDCAMLHPERVFSMRIPHIFESSTYMSFGHFIETLWLEMYRRKAFTIAMLTASDIKNC